MLLGIGVGVFLAGGGLFLGFRLLGLDGISAGIWSQVIMVGGVVGWLLTYLFRVVTGFNDSESAARRLRRSGVTAAVGGTDPRAESLPCKKNWNQSRRPKDKTYGQS